MLPPCPFNETVILDEIWMDILLSRSATQIKGLTIIGDCNGVNASILKWFTITNMKISAAKMGLMPLKNWTVHLVNMGPIISTCTSLVKPFLKKEVKERVSHIYVSVSTFSYSSILDKLKFSLKYVPYFLHLQFQFHDKNFNKLHEMVGRQCLPEEYGGHSESAIDQRFSDEFLSTREAWFNNNVRQKYGYIDSTGSGNEEDDV